MSDPASSRLGRNRPLGCEGFGRGARRPRWLPAAWWVGACIGLAWLAAGWPQAAAHQQFAPSTVNRYGKLVLSQAHGLRLFYTLMVGEAPALAWRTQADRSHEGRLDAEEQAGLCARLGALARDGISLQLDGQPLALSWDAPQCTLSGSTAQASDAVAALPIALELVTHVAWPRPISHPITLRYEDRVTIAPVGEVELRIEDGPDLRLLASWQGTAPPPPDAMPAAPAGAASEATSATVQRVYQTVGPPRSSMSDRSVSLRVVAAPASAQPVLGASRWRQRGILLVALGLVVAGIGFLLRTRLRLASRG